MPILTAAVITDFVFTNLKNYFAKKFIDKQVTKFDAKQELKLRKVINDTLEEYEAKFPVTGTRNTFPFYQSQKIINELLSYRVMHGDEYNLKELIKAFEAEPNVIPPTAQNVNDLFGIFMSKVNASNELKKLEIKETFQDEIFLISRKLDNVKLYIENIFAGFDADLQLQWKDRIDSYVTTLQAFKPQTALNLLDTLLKSVNAGSTRPSAQFCASIEFQRGVCLKFLTKQIDACKAFIKAYQLDPANGTFEEQAALAYYKLGENAKAIGLADKIIAWDEFNTMGWTVRLLNTAASELSATIDQMPHIVKVDVAFQISIYNTFNSENTQPQFNILYEKGIVPAYTSYVPKTITVNNISEHSFWLNVMINEYFHDFSFTYQIVPNEAKEGLVAALNELLGRFLGAIKETELPDENPTLHFMYAFTNYLLTEDVGYAQEMKTRYEGLKNKPSQFLFITANVLQKAGEVQTAISLIEASTQKDIVVLMLQANYYLRSDQIDKYAATVKLVAQTQTAIPHELLYAYVNQLIDLKRLGFSGEFTIGDFVDGKQFETPIDQALVEKIAEALLTGINPVITADLLELANTINDPLAQGLIATSLHLSSQHEQALAVLDKFINKTEESRDLYHYISALYHTKKNNSELLKLLEHWRLNYSFNSSFVRIELYAQRELSNWPECITIAEYFLSNEPEDEYILMHYIASLQEENSPASVAKLAAFVTKVRDYNYCVPQHAGIAATILIKQKYFTEALDLLYRYALDESNKLLRTAYFMAFTECKPEEMELWPIKEYNTVEAGHFVKYKLNGKVKFVELNEQNLKNSFNQEFIGCGKGGAFTRKRPMSGDEDLITIERIMDKYLSLHDEILEEVHDDPYSGIPLQSFTVDKNNIVESMHSMLQKVMGESGSRERDRINEELAQYYDNQRSFSEIIVGAYREDYLAGYFDLARNKKGINILPITTFSGTTAAKNYALDLSSLPIIYQMYLQHGTTYPDKFIISKYIVDVIKKQLLEAKESRNEQLLLTVTLEDIRPSQIPGNAQESNAQYLTGLLQWVNENCVVQVTERVLDFTRNIEIDDDKKNFLKYFLNTSLLLEEQEDLLLITDDLLYYNIGLTPQKIVSSEYFAKQVLPDGAPALDEFVRNRYRGFSLSLNQINNEYTKKAAGQPDLYSHCLENLSLLNNASNARIAIEHAKWLVLNSLIIQQQLESEITAVFVGLLNGIFMPGLKQNFRTLVAGQFKLLGKKKDMVLRCLENSFNITGL